MLTIFDSEVDLVERLGTRRRGKLEVCGCGHSKTRHVETSYGLMCAGPPKSGVCGCVDHRGVILAPDSRLFVFAVRQEVHPLVAGLIKTRDRGKWGAVEMLVDECDVDECREGWVTAVYVGDGFRVSELRCEEHAS